MRKIELERQVERLKKVNAIQQGSLVKIRQVARDCVKEKSSINNVWAIEEITVTLTKADII